MKKTLVFLSIFLLIIVFIIGLYINLKAKPKQLISGEGKIAINVNESLPWLEVTVGKVFVLESDESTIKKELYTGDVIQEGMILKVATSGNAIIHFYDGSEMRLEKETVIKIEKASFDPESDSLKVRAELVVGRVWSKIIELATPDSEWEVKTSNAVATVRGTSFGMEINNKKLSRIIGSENNVQIGIRNKKTNASAKTDLIVTKNQIVEINDVVADKLISLKKGEEDISSTTAKKFVMERSLAAYDLKDGWIKNSEDRDDKIRTRIKDLTNSGLDKKAVRLKLREEVKNDFLNKVEQKRQEDINKNNVPVEKPVVTSDREIKPVEDKPLINPIVTEKPVINYVNIEITTNAPTLEVVEGTEIQFTAFGILPDGNKKDITSEVSWSTLGPIGKIDYKGKLISGIEADFAEYPNSLGSVIAIFKKLDGQKLEAKSKLITVSHKNINNDVSPDIINRS